MLLSQRYKLIAPALILALVPTAAPSQPAPVAAATTAKPFQVEWVYRVKYGFKDEWWRIFQKYEIAALDEEKRRGFVRSYSVYRPELHTSEGDRWDYRIIVTYNGFDGATHEDEVIKALFPDVAAFKRDQNRRWELTTNHWDLPIREIDPYAGPE